MIGTKTEDDKNNKSELQQLKDKRVEIQKELDSLIDKPLDYELTVKIYRKLDLLDYKIDSLRKRLRGAWSDVFVSDKVIGIDKNGNKGRMRM